MTCRRRSSHRAHRHDRCARETQESAERTHRTHRHEGQAHGERRASTPLMALALFAGLVAGARFAQTWYRQEKARERRHEERERIERWEGEGGALPGTVGTGGAANPRPGL